LRVAERPVSKAEGNGVTVKEGKFIGSPMLKMAEKILSKSKQIKKG
jgi:citrate lyase beta subunit